MKSLLLSLLIIIFRVGSTCSAQSKESDRDWIDSLAVKYRMDFIESAVLNDQATLDSMGTSITVLILNIGNIQKFERTSNDDVVQAIHQYDDERQAQQLRRYAYQEEMRLARTDFSAL